VRAQQLDLSAITEWFSTPRRRAFGIGVGVAALVLAFMLVVAISTTGKPTVRTSAEGLSGDTSGAPDVNSAGAEAKGIIVLQQLSSSCSVLSVDPESGTLAQVANFPVICTRSSSNYAYFDFVEKPLFSSKFDRVATVVGDSKDGQAAWIDKSGAVTKFEPAASSPDFGSTQLVSVIGFDKQDNFYYALSGDQVDYYRVRAGSTTGEKFATLPTDATFGPLPGGTLGPGADDPRGQCYDPSWRFIPYDPDQKRVAFVYRGEVHITATFCGSDPGKALTPSANTGDISDDVVTSPDGTAAAFAIRTSKKLYRVNADGNSPPIEINAAALFDLGTESWTLYKWI